MIMKEKYKGQKVLLFYIILWFKDNNEEMIITSILQILN